MELKNCVVVITGGARGIGYAVAQHLAQAGCKLALIDIHQEQLEQSAAHLAELTEVQGYCVDLTQEELVEDTFSYILEDFGKVNVVVNNAGLLKDGMLVKAKQGQVIDKMSLEQFQQVCDVNMAGSFLCGREGAIAMIKSEQKGLIINMSSLARSGNIGQTNYAASKAAVAAMSVGWAQELARYKIRSVAIAPGVIDTDMTRNMKSEARERLEQATPCGRLGTTAEIAKTVCFIIENDYINGRVLEIDGGLRF